MVTSVHRMGGSYITPMASWRPRKTGSGDIWIQCVMLNMWRLVSAAYDAFSPFFPPPSDRLRNLGLCTGGIITESQRRVPIHQTTGQRYPDIPRQGLITETRPQGSEPPPCNLSHGLRAAASVHASGLGLRARVGSIMMLLDAVVTPACSSLISAQRGAARSTAPEAAFVSWSRTLQSRYFCGVSSLLSLRHRLRHASHLV
ncbi:hypothetical protein GY45DRAFT_1070147 [Cubamyces sp. BRFM 1775]|nr:hypothetical protein GY45DRAFT_1070147 [Cubamyces sp. BRFM 1775]